MAPAARAHATRDGAARQVNARLLQVALMQTVVREDEARPDKMAAIDDVVGLAHVDPHADQEEFASPVPQERE